MKAKKIFQRRVVIADDAFAELVAWKLPEPVLGSTHLYKYRLAFVVQASCVLRYDNEAGKGDHKHIDNKEYPYLFVDIDQLTVDFIEDIQRWQHEHSST